MQDRQMSDQLVNEAIRRCNQEDSEVASYHLLEGGSGIQIDADWMLRILDNQYVILGWLDMRLVEYLQVRNSNVLAIPLKIYAPRMRDLGHARRFWEDALANHAFTNIYTGTPFAVV